MSNENNVYNPDIVVGRNIYVDLDSIFDTRLAILDKIDPRYSILVYEAGFPNRTEDAFPKISKELFKELFDKRDSELLSRSLMTNVFNMVKSHVKENIQRMSSTPGGNNLEIFVNIWPYNLSKEGAEIIIKPFYEIEKDRVNVHALNIDPKELSASWFGQKFSFIVMYDYMRWLSNILNDPATIKHRLPKTTLIAPKLFLNETLNEREYQELLDSGAMDPFREVELACAQYIGLEYYDMPIFSALLSPIFIQERKKELGLIT